VTALRAFLGEMLQIKPLLALADGEVLPFARLRTRAKARQALVDWVDGLGRLESLAVMHTACAGEANEVAGQLADRAEERVVAEATTVLGTHVGPGALAAAAVLAAP